MEHYQRFLLVVEIVQATIVVGYDMVRGFRSS